MSIIIFDSVCGPANDYVFKAGDGLQHLALGIEWQACGKTVYVPFIGINTLWFQVYEMALLVSETNDFVFDAGTVSRASSLNVSFVKW